VCAAGWLAGRLAGWLAVAADHELGVLLRACGARGSGSGSRGTLGVLVHVLHLTLNKHNTEQERGRKTMHDEKKNAKMRDQRCGEKRDSELFANN
jgi:hypothetical protein